MVHTVNPDLKADLSTDGIELMFATNHVGHFLLTNLIMAKIVAAARTAPRGSTRIINLSSSGTFVSALRGSDISFEKPATVLPEKERPNFAMMNMAGLAVNENMAYIPTAAYGHSKTANILFAVGLNERLFEKHGILSLALNPGEIITEVGRHTDPVFLSRTIEIREKMGIHHWKTQTQGASTTVAAALDPKLSLPESDGSGQYLSDCQTAKAPTYSTDKLEAEKLWQISEGLTGQKFS